MSFFLLKKGIEGWSKYGCCTRLPKNFIDSGWGKTSLEILFVVVLAWALAIWYLFIDQGGNIFLWFKELKEFFT